MQPSPRMISKIEVSVELPKLPDDKAKTILQNAAMTCPVFLSLHPDVQKVVTFDWNL